MDVDDSDDRVDESGGSRRLWMYLPVIVFFGIICFAAFHAFIVLIWLYGGLDLWLTVVCTPALAAVLFRLPGHTLDAWSDPRALKPRSVLLIGLYCVLVVALWIHIYTGFGGIERITEPIVFLAVGYLSFFLAAYALRFLERLAIRPAIRLVNELAQFRPAVRRLLGLAVIFSLFDLGYAAIFRMISLHSADAFTPQLKSFGDALYLSTSSMTVFGSIDIAPKSGLSRTVASVAMINGLLLFTALLAFVVATSNDLVAKARDVSQTPDIPAQHEGDPIPLDNRNVNSDQAVLSGRTPSKASP
jgi:hypothetical protein